MSDLRQELYAPEYRNLVLNPGGEETSLGTGFFGSNGVTRAGAPRAGAPAPRGGSGLVEYEVTAQTSNEYTVGPQGPFDPVHRGAFKIPNSRQLSFGLSVRADRAVYIEVLAGWSTEIWNNGVPSGLSFVSTTSLGVVRAVNNTAWTDIVANVPSTLVPRDVTHWHLKVAGYSANPTTAPTRPVIGTKLWLDQLYVSDSGEDITPVWPADGSKPGWIWEDLPFYSSSRTEVEIELPPVVDDEDVLLDSPGVDESDPEYVPPVGSEPTDVDGSVVAEPPPPNPDYEVPLDAAVDDPGYRSPDAMPAYVEAEKVIGWKSDNKHIHLHEDIQLGDLVFNRMDEHGVVWLVSDIEGWWTTPEPDVPDVGRGWFDGSYETRGRYNARTFTLTGSFMPRHRGDVNSARDRLIRALNLVHAGGWFMTHEDPVGMTATKGSKVWLAGAPMIATTGANGKTDFSIALRAPNPVKQSIKDGVPPGYNSIKLVTSDSSYPEREYPRSYPWAYPEAVFGNTVVQVVNEGNAVVWPILRLAGPTNGAVKVYNADTEQTFRIIRKLYPGEVLEIDCFTKQVTLNGQGNHRFYLDIDVDWLMLQPGPNKIYFYEEVPGGLRAELEIMWRSGWIG